MYKLVYILLALVFLNPCFAANSLQEQDIKKYVEERNKSTYLDILGTSL